MANPFAAAAALRRARSLPRGRSAFEGARLGRLTSDWMTGGLRSADAELRGSATTLRERSRALVRDSSYAKGFCRLVRNNVVGFAAQGITLQVRARPGVGLSKRDAQAVEDAWAEWCERGTATADGRLSWGGLQRTLAFSEPQDGEYIVRLVPGFENDFGFAVQAYDPDLLDVTFNRPKSARENEIRMGVEVNDWGRPVAYWLWTAHPGDMLPDPRQRERVRIPADELVHDFDPIRVGQARGVSWFHAILLDARNLSAYQQAALMGARVGASSMGVLEREPDSETDPDLDDENRERLTLEAEPATFFELPAGLKLKEWKPNDPNLAFRDFVKVMLHSKAVGLGASYTSLTGDLSQTNYSSMRGGLLSERDEWRVQQGRMITALGRPVFREWAKWAYTADKIRVPPSLLMRPGVLVHQPRGWPWVDPLKDILAAKEAIAAGLDSRSRLAMENGRDFEEIIEALAEEEKIAAAAGVTLGNESSDAARTLALQDEDEPTPAERAQRPALIA